MKCLIVLCAAAALASGQLLTPLRSQYHAQNELGQYSFGYTGGPSSKQESSSGPGGITQGSFSYVDANGLVQSRSYVADPINGFRVAASDIPVDANTPVAAPVPAVGLYHAVSPLTYLARRKRQAVFAVYPIASTPADTPEVAAAKIDHYRRFNYESVRNSQPSIFTAPADTPEVAIAKINHYNQFNHESLRNAHLAGRKKRSVYAYAAPLAVAAAPVPAFYHAAPLAVAAAPVVAAPVVAPAVTSQFHSQDELGQYSYGYSNPLSSKSETRLANGVTQGAYSYLDAHGVVQSANYISDPAHGFRVAATNLPVAPVAPVA